MRSVPQSLVMAVVLGMGVTLWSPEALAQGYYRSRREASGIGAQGTDGRTNPEEYDAYESSPPVRLTYRSWSTSSPRLSYGATTPASPTYAPARPSPSYLAAPGYYDTYQGYTYYYYPRTSGYYYYYYPTR